MKPRSDAAYQAVRHGHKRLARVKLWDRDGYVADLPVQDGELVYSLSRADGVRSGRIVVPGYEWFDPVEPGGVTWVRPIFEIGGEQWDHSEFPVLRAVARRPAGEVELVLGDWAERRDTEAETGVTVGSTASTVAQTVSGWMDGVVPGGEFTITRDDSGGALVRTPIEVPLGASIWRALTTVANQVGCVVVVTSRSTGEIRRFDPWAPHHDDTEGILVEETGAIVADEAVNRVIVQAEKADPEGGTTVYRAVRTLTTGPYKYDSNGIGKRSLVEVLRLPEPTQALVDAEAQRLYDRRVGIVRSHEIRTVPMPWVEAGDVIAYRSTVFDGPTYGLVDELTMPLTATGTMRMRLRDGVIV